MLGVDRIGRYELLTHLASGGMGQVYLARTTGLGGFERHVVVKTLEVADEDDQFVTMFLDEARLVGALHHQYIAPVYEVGCDDEGRYFLVMDYIHGESVEVVWRRCADAGASLPLGFALSIVSAVASALDYAHKLCAPDGTPLEIVHRDVSLSNVMVGYQGGVKLIDFGIAKSSNRTTKTQAGTLKGKFGYLSPEQVLRKQVDHRTDIFALGIVLYELTTMTRAFHASSELLTLEKITRGDVKEPSRVVPNYPRVLETIVMKALALEPEHRFTSAGEMARAIELFARTQNIVIGDPAIVGVMSRFERAQPGNRRLAKSSGMVQTDRKLMAQLVADAEAEAQAAAAADEEDTPIIARPVMEVVDEDDDRTIPISSSDSIAPLIAPMLRAPTATAELRRREIAERRSRVGVWIAIALVVVAAAIAIVLGLT